MHQIIVDRIIFFLKKTSLSTKSTSFKKIGVENYSQVTISESKSADKFFVTITSRLDEPESYRFFENLANVFRRNLTREEQEFYNWDFWYFEFDYKKLCDFLDCFDLKDWKISFHER